MSRPPFSMLRAAFWLLAAVILTELAVTLIGIAGCFWVIVVNGREQFGACQNISQTMREVWSEVLAAILALLLAARSGPPPPPPPPHDMSIGDKPP